MKLIVCGSREWTNANLINEILDKVHARRKKFLDINAKNSYILADD